MVQDNFKRLIEGVQDDAKKFNAVDETVEKPALDQIEEQVEESTEEKVEESTEVVKEEKTNAPNDADVKAMASKSKAKSDSTDKQTADANAAVKTNDIDGKVKSEDGIPAQGGVPEVKAQADSKTTKESVEEATEEVVEKKTEESVEEAKKGECGGTPRVGEVGDEKPTKESVEEVIVEGRLSPRAFQRMEGLVDLKAMSTAIEAVKNVYADLRDDGFDDPDINLYLQEKLFGRQS